jgi:hypothetical protein
VTVTNADLAQQFLQSGEGALMAGDDATIDLVSAVVSALLAVADSIDRLATVLDGPVTDGVQIVKPKSKAKRVKRKRMSPVS